MKKGNYVRITKFGEKENPLFKSADARNFKAGEVNSGVSLPMDYWVEGHLSESVVEGKPVKMFREVRNGVKSAGIFQTSPVTKIEKSGVGICDIVETHNSKYMIEILS